MKLYFTSFLCKWCDPGCESEAQHLFIVFHFLLQWTNVLQETTTCLPVFNQSRGLPSVSVALVDVYL